MRWLALLLILLAAPAGAGVNGYSLDFEGRERSFLLYLPERHAGPMPLVIVLHGGGGTAAQIRRGTRQSFEKLAERDGFAVVYPEALGRLWDLGGDPVSAGLPFRRDDTGFVAAVVEAVSGLTEIDRNRVYATGISRGGQMAFTLGCRRPDLVSGIAVVAMGLPEFLLPECRRAMPVAVLNGTADPLVPWDGGEITLGRQERGRVLGAEATLARFVRLNGCGGTREVARIGAAVRVIDGTGCGAPARLYRIEGGGHSWPGERSILPRRIVGETNRDIDAAVEIWSFFSRLR